MPNFLKNQIVYLTHKESLAEGAMQCLKIAINLLLRYWGKTDGDLLKAHSNLHAEIGFAKIMRLWVIPQGKHQFNEKYIDTLYKVYTEKNPRVAPEDFEAITRSNGSKECRLYHTWNRIFKHGCGIWLVAMHESRLINLPFAFSLPYTINKDSNKREDFAMEIYGTLTKCIRSIDTLGTSQSSPIFENFLQEHRSSLVSHGSKTIYALGWQEPEDVNLADLLSIKEANENTHFTGQQYNPPIRLMLDLFNQAFPDRMSLTVAEYDLAAREATRKSLSEKRLLKRSQSIQSTPENYNTNPATIHESSINVTNEAILIDEILKLKASTFHPSKLESTIRLPGLSINIGEKSKVWRNLEDVYTTKSKRENYRTTNLALSRFNLYLFAYLAGWYALNKHYHIDFPTTPNKLIGPIFISKLIVNEKEHNHPLSFIEFLNLLQQRCGWNNNNVYQQTKQLEVFFEFIERHKGLLPECDRFKQPISDFDYPAVTRSLGTPKGHIPRHIYGLMVAYVSALVCYAEAMYQRSISAPNETDPFAGLQGGRSRLVIDTMSFQDKVGFVPMVYWKGRGIVLKRIPNVFHFEKLLLKDGRLLKLPQPHSIIQIFVALHTGLRHNHIQWLDAETFDKFVEPGDSFPKLLVNTDKAKTSAWTPCVHKDVISALRKQREWRNLIAEPGFSQRIFYNENPNTKWGSYLPLFSAHSNGTPHSDDIYDSYWRAILAGLQWTLPDFEIKDIRLIRLLPPKVHLSDPSLKDKLFDHWREETYQCNLRISTLITPHSARVSVVSHLITILPAEVIGKYVTGQTEGLVSHYVKLDSNDIIQQQQIQNLALRNRVFEDEFAALINRGTSKNPHHIHADHVNSSLARSMRMNVQETIATYGCISLTLNEDVKNGIDVLTETDVLHAAFNKTEICPYGNHCPTDLIKQLKGIRRCGLCPYAVRSVDHLPAIAAKKKQMMELRLAIDDKLSACEADNYTPEEIDALEDDRQRITEELTGWIVVEEILEATRQRIADGAGNRKWVVEKPEIIQQKLSRISTPSGSTEYLLSRLSECISYPILDSPRLRAQLEILRIKLTVQLGNFVEAINSRAPANPASECVGLLRTLVEAHGLTYKDLREMLESEKHLALLPKNTQNLLEFEP